MPQRHGSPSAHGQLVAALSVTVGALAAAMDSLGIPETASVRFSGEWEHLGARTLGSVLDEANVALGAARGGAK